MNKDTINQISNIDTKGVLRTLAPVISELGIFNSALILYDTLYGLLGQEGAVQCAEKIGIDFPLFGELIDYGLLPDQIKLSIEKNSKALIDNLIGYSTIVVVGIEAVILDRVFQKLPETKFYLIPHYDNIDVQRVSANFPHNVKLISVRDVTTLAGAGSILISYVFCQSNEGSFIYPITLRSIGPDVRSSYNQIIGLAILSDYKRYITRLSYIYSTSEFFTSIMSII